jgi:ribosome-associated toxin RatA of RatAB toxin-antitoxin module
MSVTVTERVLIDAPLAEVLAVVRDVDDQSSWWPGMLHSEVLATHDDGLVARARLVNDVKVARDEFELDYTHTDTTVAWSLARRSLAQKGQTGSWTLVDRDGATEVTLALEVDSTLPLPGLVQRKVVRDTVRGAIRALQRRCEG